jgi:hypothetical protein
MAAANDKEEIIEKKASAPVATSCLIIACVALIGAVALQVTEIAGYRSGSVVMADKDPGQAMARASLKKIQGQVKEILGASPESGGEGSKDEPTLDSQAPEEGSAETPKEAESAKDAEPAKDAAEEPAKDAAEEPAKDAAAEPAKDAAEEPAKDAAADADASTEEAPAEEK